MTGMKSMTDGRRMSLRASVVIPDNKNKTGTHAHDLVDYKSYKIDEIIVEHFELAKLY